MSLRSALASKPATLRWGRAGRKDTAGSTHGNAVANVDKIPLNAAREFLS